ncbi:MAG TPA: PilZ domain-containing protein [Terracidiphilus sp.]|nr:PilZ domain-containing protein [Terracidiphilus sp.]
MNTKRYCVYNETNECFLSLEVSLGDNTIAQLKRVFGKGPLGPDEGCWIIKPSGLQTLRLFSSRDLIYLDAEQKVVNVLESFPPFRMAPVEMGAASLLDLPVSTVQCSQTQPGNQLVICEAEEMQFHLRPAPGQSTSTSSTSDGERHPHREKAANDRRIAPRKRWPRLAAFDAAGDPVDLRGIRDISATGLYLMTGERWPIGTQLRMSFQRTNGLDDNSMVPTTVDLRVSRWGDDGVGLEFVKADAEHSALLAMHMR